MLRPATLAATGRDGRQSGSTTGKRRASDLLQHRTPGCRGRKRRPTAVADLPHPGADMSDQIPVRRALLSVYDKTGLPELATALHAAGVELVSTGSTAGVISGAGVPVTPVEQITEFPECLDGRVKTLHPRIHAGILADRRLDAHREQLEQLDVQPFDLVVVNLYPFADTVASGASEDE